MGRPAWAAALPERTATVTTELTITEAFEIAEQIEREASAFFRRSADAATTPAARRVLLDLAEMETEHVGVFSALKSRLAGRSAPAAGAAANRGAQTARLLAAIVARNVLDTLHETFGGRRLSDDLLEAAIEFERDTIVFYTAMKRMLGDPADRERLDEIILEELGHILSLRGKTLGPPV